MSTDRIFNTTLVLHSDFNSSEMYCNKHDSAKMTNDSSIAGLNTLTQKYSCKCTQISIRTQLSNHKHLIPAASGWFHICFHHSVDSYRNQSNKVIWTRAAAAYFKIYFSQQSRENQKRQKSATLNNPREGAAE